MNCNCPLCGSTKTKKSSAVFEQGSSSSISSTSGVGLSSSGKVGFFSSKTSNTRITAAAEKNSPDEDYQLVGCLAAPFVILVVFIGLKLDWGAFSIAASFIIVVLITFGVYAHLTRDYRAEKSRKYDKQWYCLQCGHIFSNEFNAAIISIPSKTRLHEWQEYVDRIQNPIQKSKNETERDSLGLLSIWERVGTGFEFNPIEPSKLDLGLVSRLSSLGYLEYDSNLDCFRLTDLALSRIEVLRERG